MLIRGVDYCLDVDIINHLMSKVEHSTFRFVKLVLQNERVEHCIQNCYLFHHFHVDVIMP